MCALVTFSEAVTADKLASPASLIVHTSRQRGRQLQAGHCVCTVITQFVDEFIPAFSERLNRPRRPGKGMARCFRQYRPGASIFDEECADLARFYYGDNRQTIEVT